MESLRGTRVLVTGGAGFIGSHLVRRLVNEGADVNIIVKDNQLQNIQDVMGKVKIFNTDITDFEKLKKTVKEIEPVKIFHLAAYVNPERLLAKTDVIFKENVLGTVNLIKSLENINYSCFVNTGTCEEYGQNEVPFTEDQRENPVSPYSASKVCSTHVCQMYGKIYGLPIVILRPFLTYGPYQRAGLLIPSLIMNILTNKDFKMTKGEQTREFNFVEDIVDGFIKASTNKKAIGEIINIGNGKEVQIREIVRKICSLMSAKIKIDDSMPYREGETMHFYSSNKKAKKILGWEPKVNIEEGLKRTIKWYVEKFKDGSYVKWMSNN